MRAHEGPDARDRPGTDRIRGTKAPAQGWAPGSGGLHHLDTLLALQRMAGNAAVDDLLQAGAEPAGDVFEPPRWRSNSDLWYFDGERHAQGDPHPTEVTLSVDGQRPYGSLQWSVADGTDGVELSGHEGPEVQARSTRGSAGTDEVRVGVSRVVEGSVVASYEGSLGVRTPAAVRAVSFEPAGTAAAYPVPDDEESPVEESAGTGEEEAGEDQEVAAALPAGGPAEEGSAAPKSLSPKGATHNPDVGEVYHSRIKYEVLDDKGKAMKGFDVNEKWASGVVNDDPSCNWARGPEGATHIAGTQFDDVIGAYGSGGTPTPTATAPKSPPGTTKVQHWSQEWYVGSLTPGSGTKVQTNTLQKYLDHGAHENITSPP